MGHVLLREQLVGRPLSEVFSFFADASNLEVLTPSFLQFQILTPRPIEMRDGAVIDYSLRLFGIRVKWKTLIESFEPERRFVDVQLSGPYRFWRHEHEFSGVPEGTLIRDRVTYELPFGPIGEIAWALGVRRTVDRIFDFRKRAIEKPEIWEHTRQIR